MNRRSRCRARDGNQNSRTEIRALRAEHWPIHNQSKIGGIGVDDIRTRLDDARRQTSSPCFGFKRVTRAQFKIVARKKSGVTLGRIIPIQRVMKDRISRGATEGDSLIRVKRAAFGTKRRSRHLGFQGPDQLKVSLWIRIDEIFHPDFVGDSGLHSETDPRLNV